jgi:hypothetical protein
MPDYRMQGQGMRRRAGEPMSTLGMAPYRPMQTGAELEDMRDADDLRKNGKNASSGDAYRDWFASSHGYPYGYDPGKKLYEEGA